MGPEDYTDNYDYDDWGDTDEEAAANEPSCYPLGEPGDEYDDDE